jgi:lipopolysaccharide export system protein LptA
MPLWIDKGDKDRVDTRVGIRGEWVLFLWILLVPMGLTPSPGGAEESPLSRFTTTEGGQTLSITANKMLIRSQENRILFEGDVVIERDGLVLKAGEVEMVFVPMAEDKGGIMDKVQEKREISSITALHDVALTRGQRRITSQQVVYFRKEEKMVFTGDPVVRENNDEVRGRKITVYLKDDRALVEGGAAVLHPK